MDVLDKKTVTVGNKGKDVRSDCQVTMELAESGGIQLIIESRVQVLYGAAIRKLTEEILEFFEVKHAKVFIEDSGSLDFTLAARLEAAMKKLYPNETIMENARIHKPRIRKNRNIVRGWPFFGRFCSLSRLISSGMAFLPFFRNFLPDVPSSSGRAPASFSAIGVSPAIVTNKIILL